MICNFFRDIQYVNILVRRSPVVAVVTACHSRGMSSNRRPPPSLPPTLLLTARVFPPEHFGAPATSWPPTATTPAATPAATIYNPTGPNATEGPLHGCPLLRKPPTGMECKRYGQGGCSSGGENVVPSPVSRDAARN